MTNSIKWFLKAKTSEVFDRFSELRGARQGETWLFVPGSLDDRVLLVAHADTVFKNPPMTVVQKGNIMYSSGTVGIGADDRAGCAMMWELRNLGHSILITDGEENGGIGARAAVREIVDELSDHLFAVEVDRAGDMEHVTYSGTSSPDFLDFLDIHFPHWKNGRGSYTDIATICPAADICGINLAAGYIYNHSKDEVLLVDAWMRTYNLLRAMLVTDDLPRFQPVAEPNRWIGSGTGKGFSRKGGNNYDYESWWRYQGVSDKEPSTPKKLTNGKPKESTESKESGKQLALVTFEDEDDLTSRDDDAPDFDPDDDIYEECAWCGHWRPEEQLTKWREYVVCITPCQNQIDRAVNG